MLKNRTPLGIVCDIPLRVQKVLNSHPPLVVELIKSIAQEANVSPFRGLPPKNPETCTIQRIQRHIFARVAEHCQLGAQRKRQPVLARGVFARKLLLLQILGEPIHLLRMSRRETFEKSISELMSQIASTFFCNCSSDAPSRKEFVERVLIGHEFRLGIELVVHFVTVAPPKRRCASERYRREGTIQKSF